MRKLLFYTTISVLAFSVSLIPSRVISPTITLPSNSHLESLAMLPSAQEDQEKQVLEMVSEGRSQRIARRRVLPDVKIDIIK